MSFLKKTVSLLAIFSVIPAAYAVTSRASVSNVSTARRLPTLTAYINGKTSGVSDGIVSVGSSNSDVTLEDLDCLTSYTECMKADEACGSEFQECTTRTLFHGQMPECLHILTQCTSSGINDLFGTSNVGDLGEIASQDSKTGEVLDYTYPLDGSAMGQWITSAAINNQFDTSTCVKRYTSCLNKDSVCGADFELCTTPREFKKQALLCDSTLARCQSEGVIELLGTYPWKSSSPSVGGRVAKMIEDGAALASYNAVSTCYKIIDQCFLGACNANPLRCIEGSTLDKVTAANLLVEDASPVPGADGVETILTKKAVNTYLKTSCLDTVGASKYCYMTFFEKTPSKTELADVDMQEEVFDMALNQRKKYVDSKIQDMIQKFDTKANQKCTETIRSCVMRSCGEGVGSVCYTSVFNGKDESINKAAVRKEIKRSCESVVNTDTNCQYAYASVKDQAYAYTFADGNVFDTLFPEYEEGVANDPIGVVGSLNATLAGNYSVAAIAEMKKQCQNVATSCVKSMCGTDYVNCYRNRTDIYSDLTDSGDTKFDKSMNKVGGVLDYTIVLGLCMNTVKTADVCEEHLKITQARLKRENDSITNNWGGADSVRGGWVDAGSAKTVTSEIETTQSIDENGNPICTNSQGVQGVCNTVDSDGNVFSTPVMESMTTYLTTQAANTLFKELITDLEYEAQAKYNAKLTKQQNMCMSSNAGGIMGKNDMGSTFMWAKLKSAKVPANYATVGLQPNQFVASNDLYGSFCRVRVNITSDDKDIQDALSKSPKWATAYFAAGDSFTCGSWINGDDLEEIANAVAKDARTDKEREQEAKGLKNLEWWLAPVVAAGAGIGGAYLGKGIVNGDVFGGLSGKTGSATKEHEKQKNACTTAVDNSLSELTTVKNNAKQSMSTLNASVSSAISAAGKLGITTDTVSTNQDVFVEKHAAWGSASGDAQTNANTEKETAAGELRKSLNSLRLACLNADYKLSEAEEKKTKIAAGVGGAVTALAGGALTVGIVKAIKNSALTKAEQEAYDKFMEEIGSHIFCTIGGEEAGSYGDVVSTSME